MGKIEIIFCQKASQTARFTRTLGMYCTKSQQQNFESPAQSLAVQGPCGSDGQTLSGCFSAILRCCLSFGRCSVSLHLDPFSSPVSEIMLAVKQTATTTPLVMRPVSVKHTPGGAFTCTQVRTRATNQSVGSSFDLQGMNSKRCNHEVKIVFALCNKSLLCATLSRRKGHTHVCILHSCQNRQHCNLRQT